ncbi:MAG: class II aldolase/adducin family protein [Granulosicoccus sp.]
MSNNNREDQLAALKALSSRVGNDPLQVQAAGGNTSIKVDDTLWIKASGKWLAHALDSDLFVPVALSPLLQALAENDPRAEKSTDFILDALNVSGLRPSIETTVHAVLPQRVVVHVHCVDTIALAIRTDAIQQLTDRLADFNWLWVPYFRPGLPLSVYISEHLESGTDVIVLGNHGLVVAADSVEQAASLLESVRLAVRQPVAETPEKDTGELQGLCSGTDYVPASCADTHVLACNEQALSVAAGGSLYPDHVIFLGNGTVVLNPEQEDPASALQTHQRSEQPSATIAVTGQGVLMHSKSNESQHAMARCLADVCRRVPPGASINYLGTNDTYSLLNWEAETYRQSIAD